MNRIFNQNLLKVITGIVIAVVAVLVLFQAPAVFAQTTQVIDDTTNGDKGGFVLCGNKADNPCQIGHLFAAFIVIINYLIAMAGFLAVLAIVYAGFMMVYSQGQEQLKAAKGRFSGAIIGLVLVAAAFVLINALFHGSLSIGVKYGADILTSPLEYIQKQ